MFVNKQSLHIVNNKCQCKLFKSVLEAPSSLIHIIATVVAVKSRRSTPATMDRVQHLHTYTISKRWWTTIFWCDYEPCTAVDGSHVMTSHFSSLWPTINMCRSHYFSLGSHGSVAHLHQTWDSPTPHFVDIYECFVDTSPLGHMFWMSSRVMTMRLENHEMSKHWCAHGHAWLETCACVALATASLEAK